MRMMLRRTLTELGYQVSEAATGTEALTLLASRPEPPALLLVDWNMPEMNGLDLVKRVRGNPVYAPTRVMMVTTETEMEQIADALGAGADEYVMKPFTKDILADKLQILGFNL
jgi:two-component system chemotaxis response regulator CheY